MTKRFWNSLTRATFKKFKLEDAISPNAFIGKTVFAHKGAPDGERESVKIESILGSKRWTKCMEINGTHLVTMLSFFTQLMEGREPSPEENAEFELATEIKDIREIKENADS